VSPADASWLASMPLVCSWANDAVSCRASASKSSWTFTGQRPRQPAPWRPARPAVAGATGPHRTKLAQRGEVDLGRRSRMAAAPAAGTARRATAAPFRDAGRGRYDIGQGGARNRLHGFPPLRKTHSMRVPGKATRLESGDSSRSGRDAPERPPHAHAGRSGRCGKASLGGSLAVERQHALDIAGDQVDLQVDLATDRRSASGSSWRSCAGSG
jgi:hypothetical protein